MPFVSHGKLFYFLQPFRYSGTHAKPNRLRLGVTEPKATKEWGAFFAPLGESAATRLEVDLGHKLNDSRSVHRVKD